MSISIAIVAYLALFTSAGLLFVFANLLLGRFVRPSNPHREKREIYECGEPAIGSSFVQFDLRFYVVALLFIIFEVEIAFFFPWATVFGKATHLLDPRLTVVEAHSDQLGLTSASMSLHREMGVTEPAVLSQFSGSPVDDPAVATTLAVRDGARQLAWICVIDIGIFFVVLLVGFAYVWKRGDLDWVRAVGRTESAQSERGPPTAEIARKPVLSP